MPYRKFLIFNALGGIIWGLGFTMLGYLAGASYHTLENYAGKVSQAILLVVVIGVLILLLRRHRAKAASLAADPVPPEHERTSPDSVATPSAES
jgi:membrane-associated protein